jgi:hypothetical protein
MLDLKFIREHSDEVRAGIAKKISAAISSAENKKLIKNLLEQ